MSGGRRRQIAVGGSRAKPAGGADRGDSGGGYTAGHGRGLQHQTREADPLPFRFCGAASDRATVRVGRQRGLVGRAGGGSGRRRNVSLMRCRVSLFRLMDAVPSAARAALSRRATHPRTIFFHPSFFTANHFFFGAQNRRRGWHRRRRQLRRPQQQQRGRWRISSWAQSAPQDTSTSGTP